MPNRGADPFRLSLLLVTTAWLALCVGCGGGQLAPAADVDAPGPVLAGEPTLLNGARLLPDASADVPLPRLTAKAGVDFAADRFIVIFDNNPAAAALAPYMGAGNNGVRDAVLATDNKPLVQHPYFRRISRNLGDHYGLRGFSRVFYKDVNFAVYEVDGLADVAELDRLMLRVLNENPGLVREVCYDMYVKAVGLDGEFIELEADGLDELFRNYPPVHPLPESAAAARTASIAPPNDPYHVNRDGDNDAEGRGTWALWRMGAVAGQAWDNTTGSEDVVVAVVDTGVRFTHTDLADNCINPLTDPPYNEPGILTDVINKDNDPSDGHGHGTFCAGQIGAQGNNGIGLAGVCWDVTLLPIKVLADSGYGTDAQVAEGMLLADYLGANIISMSLAGEFPDRTTQLAAQQCNSDGMLVISAAANDNTSAPRYPGFYPECLCVGATTLVNDSNNEDFSLVDGTLPIDTRYDARAGFSNYGTWVDIAAPGVKSLSTARGSDTAYAFGWAGTSMATPHVAGCAALLWSYIDNPDNETVRGLLQASATEMDHLNTAANPDGFLDNTSNGPVRFCNVWEAMQLYNGGPYDPPQVSWDNPADAGTVSGDVEIRLDVTPGDGNVLKVEFETYTRQLGAVVAEDNGFYRMDWDTAFEFNRELELKAIVHDDKGNIVRSSIFVTPDNDRSSLPWSEDFTGIANDALPLGWTRLDGNQGTVNTQWGATDAIGDASPPSLHSSGSAATYASSSNDFVFAPVVDLSDYAAATLSFNRRYDTGSSDYMFFISTSDDRNYNYDYWNEAGLHEWDAHNRDLSQYAGGEVRLLWVLLANGSGNAGGLWIDDLELSVASGTPPTITIDSPENGSTQSGLVQLDLTVSDDTEWIEVSAMPPQLGSLIYSPIPDNDGGPDKTYTLYWDSRHTYNGGVLLTVRAYDDENDDGIRNDFVATAQIALAINNPARDPDWFSGFEGITELGGVSGGAFDGDWYTWSFGDAHWRIDTSDPRSGSQCARMGPDGPGNYGANELDQLYSPVHDASGAARPYLRFWHKLDLESGTGDMAKLFIVRYDGLDDIETPLAEYRSDIGSGEWTYALFSLAGLNGDPFRFNFVLDSDNDTDAGTGWWIDDFELLDADPQITSISSNSRGQGGDVRTISGANFSSVQEDATVTFTNTSAGRSEATVNSWSDTSIEVVVPADAASGDVIVNVLGFDSPGHYFAVVMDAPSLDNLDRLQ